MPLQQFAGKRFVRRQIPAEAWETRRWRRAETKRLRIDCVGGVALGLHQRAQIQTLANAVHEFAPIHDPQSIDVPGNVHCYSIATASRCAKLCCARSVASVERRALAKSAAP